MVDVGSILMAGVLEFIGLPVSYPAGFLQLLSAALLGLGLIAVLTWADKRRPVELRMVRPHNPVHILWVFETLVLAVLIEWFAILVHSQDFVLPAYSE